MNLLRSRPLILASQSATRQMLLRNAGVGIDVVASQVDERALQTASGLGLPSEIAGLLARAKAEDVSLRFPDRIVIGADQTLALGKRLLNKPGDRGAAGAQLRALSNATHELHSAVAVMRGGGVLFQHVAIARMTMRPLSEANIETYLDAAGDAVLRSVGAYQLEGLGAHLFSRIDGDHFTILGLPLLPLLDFLRREKLLAF